MLAHSAEARSACAESAEALTESKEVKSKIPKGCCTLSQPACIVHPALDQTREDGMDQSSSDDGQG